MQVRGGKAKGRRADERVNGAMKEDKLNTHLERAQVRLMTCGVRGWGDTQEGDRREQVSA